MDKEKKKDRKFSKIMSWVISVSAVIVLFKACAGSFDEGASDITGGAYGTGEDEITATVKNTEIEKTELNTYADYTAEIEWLDSIGALDSMGSWATEEDIINLYNTIQTNMQTWNVTMEDMRAYVNDFEPNLTLDEIEQLSDYGIYCTYGRLMGYIETVDAEEPNWEEETTAYVVTENNIVDWFRNATEGEYVQVTGKVMGVYNFPDGNMIQLSFHVGEHSIFLTCEGNIDISNILEGDIVTVLGTYRGKNAIGYGVIDTQSVT